jgi:hypothetical protein
LPRTLVHEANVVKARAVHPETFSGPRHLIDEGDGGDEGDDDGRTAHARQATAEKDREKERERE